MLALIGGIAALLALAGAVLALLAARALRRLAATPAPAGPALPASILKPLHGAPPGLRAALRATLDQRHAAPFEVLCILRDPADPAGPVAQAALAAAPGTAGRLIQDGRVHGANAKVSQLMNLEAVAAHPVLVLADADMLVPADWLTTVTAPLADPGIGLVTCLYRGEPAVAGLWARLAGLGIDWQFLPNAAFGEALGKAQGCYGATIALRAETLARLGGFAAVKDLLADDHALGVAVRRLGLRVVVAPVLPRHLMEEASPGALWRHELRWQRTLRLLNLPGYCGLGLTFPLVWGALAAALLPGGWAVLGLAAAARLAQVIMVDRTLGHGLSPPRLVLLPLRDALGFLIWAAGLARGSVEWRGQRFRMRADGSMVPVRQR